MDTKTILSLVARHGCTVAAGYFAAHGLLPDGTTTDGLATAFFALLGLGFSVWDKYGRDIVKAQLEILRAKVMNAAAQARQNPAAAAPALAKLDAHVVTTAPTAAAAAAVASAALLAIGLSALALGWSSPLYAQSASAPKLTKMPAARPAAANTSSKVTQASAQQNPLLVLQAFTVTDAQAALADANGQTPPDTVAAACYTAIIAMLSNPLSDPLPQQPGLFIAYQKARDAKAFLSSIQSPTGPLAPLNQACASLVLDAQQTLIGLGVATGVIAATATAGGAPLLALPALPALSSLLPAIP